MTPEEKRLLLEDLDLVADQNKVVAHTQVDRIFASALGAILESIPIETIGIVECPPKPEPSGVVYYREGSDPAKEKKEVEDIPGVSYRLEQAKIDLANLRTIINGRDRQINRLED